MAETVKITGLDDVIARLKALPKELVGKNGGPIRRALYKAGLPLKKDLIARVPRAKQRNQYPPYPGLLADSISLFRDRAPQERGAAEAYTVGVRPIIRAYANTAKNRRMRRVGKKYKVPAAGWYIKFLEFGTKGGQRNGKGIQPPRKLFTNEFEAHKQDVVNDFGNALRGDVDRTIEKLARKKAGQL